MGDKKDKKRRLGALQKAACDAMVSSACGAAGVPPAVCNCFKKDLSTKCQGYISRRSLGDKKDKKDKKMGKKSKKDKKSRRLGAKAVLLTVAKKCMDGNNVPGAAQGIVNGAINSLPISRRLGALQKAACDAMVSSACGA